MRRPRFARGPGVEAEGSVEPISWCRCGYTVLDRGPLSRNGGNLEAIPPIAWLFAVSDRSNEAQQETSWPTSFTKCEILPRNPPRRGRGGSCTSIYLHESIGGGMDLGVEITLLTVLSAVLFLVGILLIVISGPTLTIIGIVLVILSAVVFLVDIADILGHWRRITDE